MKTQTFGIDIEVKYGFVGIVFTGGKVESEFLATSDILFHLGAVIELEERPDTPHEREDVQMLVVGRADVGVILVILHGDQTRQDLGRLGNK